MPVKTCRTLPEGVGADSGKAHSAEESSQPAARKYASQGDAIAEPGGASGGKFRRSPDRRSAAVHYKLIADTHSDVEQLLAYFGFESLDTIPLRAKQVGSSRRWNKAEGRVMSTLIKLVQGTSEWHAHRARYRNASETAAVMGVSPWQTPYQLWALRTGRSRQEVTPAMARGTALEPQARQAYEELTGQVMQPLVLVEGDYSASLDGMTFDGQMILEIKCPMKGRESSLWKAVAEEKVPEHYGWQIEHQLMVSGAAMAHLYVFDGKEGLLLEILPQPERWVAIQVAWDGFMRCN